MKQLSDIALTTFQSKALDALRRQLLAEFDIEMLILYGSVARGDADAESDVDLLVVTKEPYTRQHRHKITDVVFEINLNFGTNFSTLVVDKDSWEAGIVSVLPIRQEILQDGIRV